VVKERVARALGSSSSKLERGMDRGDGRWHYV
jgi:hypothetical protein